jgi:geranylgeranyl transferase type-2 subunit beta
MIYLQNLTQRLADGLSRLPESGRALHIAYLHGAQNPDGGFSGRLGGSDLYYTAFALRSLAVMNALAGQVAERAVPYLRRSLREQATVIDFFSLLYACALIQAATGIDVLADSPADWPDRVAGSLETLRAPDGGYGKSPGSNMGSTYHTFLVGLCYQLLGRGYPHSEEVRAFVESRRREDGGYVELAPMRRGGTNPTAAAVGTLQLLGNDPLPADVVDGVSRFLLDVRADRGGLKAHNRIPFADLLSTFTGSWTMAQLGRLHQLDRTAIGEYAERLVAPGGGFKGHAFDDDRDVEYTFYGLGLLGLVSHK